MSWIRVLPVLFAMLAAGCQKRALERDAGSGTIGPGIGGGSVGGGAGGGTGAGAGGSSSGSPDARPDGFPVTEQENKCGNGVLDPGEECDDHNLVSGDGCTHICQIECYESCGACGRRGPNGACIGVGCGNRVLDPGEACDDGNVNAGDGCSSTCTIEPGWRCPAIGRACAPICGDGRLVGVETCDDGNAIAGDGCNEICVVEPSPDLCGDGRIEGAEECDVGAFNDDAFYDGCSPTCRYGARCGDGVLDGPEECDFRADRNTARYGDTGGCTSRCTLPHYCGDGHADIENGEQCDLGLKNGMAGQPCAVTCRICIDC